MTIRKRGESMSDKPTSQIAVRLLPELADRLRNAVAAMPRYTLTRFIEEAITEKLDSLEAERGRRFPKRKQELRKRAA
jgi:hypothetical protein